MPKLIKDNEVYAETCKLLVEYGFDGMTTKILAERAAMDESSLFRKYESKTKLVCKAVNYIFSNVPLAKLQWTGDLTNDLNLIVKNYYLTAQEFGPLLQVVIMEVNRNPQLQQSITAVKQNIAQILMIIEKYQKSGMLKKGNSMELIASFLGPLAMMTMNPLGIIRDKMNLPDYKKYVDRFLTGYGNQ